MEQTLQGTLRLTGEGLVWAEPMQIPDGHHQLQYEIMLESWTEKLYAHGQRAITVRAGSFDPFCIFVSGSRISRYMLQVDILGIRLMSVSRPTTEEPLSHEPLLTAQVRWKTLIPMEQA